MAKSVPLGDFGTVRVTNTGRSTRVFADGQVHTIPVLRAEGDQLDKGYPTPWFAEFTVAGREVRLTSNEDDRSAHFVIYPEYRGKLARALQSALR